ncbi:hypothetical protein TGPRC2_272265 [Toxoplasma gondii TgCatPRC2]|uniref:Uncharacterized protein n=2 Tax=Toxoplasma gondii TaxID=5811 RepID=A0A151HPR3_TOXGO|nr:hypothetical protein TGME49_272265 [Toxoplasma gondii ME49]EPT28567.1 hypothetical protein TGME49_272265 [Toxoplasma gondii ME49]KYK71231.1 hypothetical protein TGPRC2_272265 [Toxoplasma gondii TgCatPRC2]|eukprot:XP_018636687.1 hypothetical protein TGME49_272265 [Toxoplasma gondii ME49]
MSFSVPPTSTSDRVALSDKPDPYFVLNPDMFDDAALWTAPRLQSLCEVLGLDPGAHSFSRRGRRGRSREELVRCLRDFHRNRWYVDRRRGAKNSTLTGTKARPEESQEGSNFFLVPVDFVDIPRECVKVFEGGTTDAGGAKRSRSILKYSCSSRHPRSDNSSPRSISKTTYITSKAGETKEWQRTRKRKRSAVDAAKDDTEKLPSNKRIRFSAFNNVQLIDPRPDETESTEWGFKLPFGCAKRE